MSTWHGRISRPQLLALCMPELWNDRVALHERCAGASVVQNWSPSGSEPQVIGICTCPCHDERRRQVLQENMEEWEAIRKAREIRMGYDWQKELK